MASSQQRPRWRQRVAGPDPSPGRHRGFLLRLLGAYVAMFVLAGLAIDHVQTGDVRDLLVAGSTDGAQVQRELADLRRSSLLTFGATLLVSVPLLYLVAGRGLAQQYRRAADASDRDPLTGLGNHRRFREVLAAEGERAARYGGELCLALVDVDKFKAVNDQQGHRAGDAVLAQLAGELAAGRSADEAFRIGGDEFAVVLPGTELAQARTAMERLHAAVATIGTSVSIGVATFHSSGDLEELRDDADTALYEAKRLGRNRVVTADEVIDRDAAVLSSSKVHALRGLLEEGRLGAAFQPIWNLEDETILAYEAHVRIDPASGISGPREAFDVAERMGCAAQFDALCRQVVLAHATHLPPGAQLFLNLAAQSLEHEAGSAERLLEEVRRAGLSPDRVVLELSGRSALPMRVIARAAATIRELGFGLAVNDVGAGNVGLALLGEVVFDFVKLDGDVVRDALVAPRSRAIVAAVCALADELGSRVIAEGVETEPVLAFVQRLPLQSRTASIPLAQGYLLAAPIATFDDQAATVSSP